MTSSGSTGTPTAEDLGVALLPQDDVELTPEQDIATAAASALDQPVNPLPDDPAIPLGMSWFFDFELGRFARAGTDATQVRGAGALGQWCMMAVRTARGAHAALSDEFGFDEPDDVIGGVTILADDFVQRIRAALLPHDRITDVQADGDYDPSSGTFTLTELVVTTDDDQQLDFGELAIPITTDPFTYGN